MAITEVLRVTPQDAALYLTVHVGYNIFMWRYPDKRYVWLGPIVVFSHAAVIALRKERIDCTT